MIIKYSTKNTRAIFADVNNSVKMKKPEKGGHLNFLCKKRRYILFLLTVFSFIQFSYGQEREKKINTIMDSFNFVETQKRSLVEFGLNSLKTQITSEKDSIKLAELEEKLTEQEIRKRINQAFTEIFTDKEIDELYAFVQTSSFYKLNKTSLVNNSISSQFEDINTELNAIAENIEKNNESYRAPVSSFEPIPVEREDGFYATVGYDANKDFRDIQLKTEPAITKEDILEVRRVIDENGFSSIGITLKKEGASKFYQLTEDNIAKPIAIVIDKYIISMPIVHASISSGEVSIRGNFSLEEVDNMIKKLKGK